MASADPPYDALSPTERKVLRACHLRTNAEVATLLGCTTGTVEKHVQNARRKLGAPSKLVATRMLHEFEHSQKLGSQFSPISFPETNLSNGTAGASSASTDRLAETRIAFEAMPTSAANGVERRPNADQQLTRLTLILAVIALLILTLGHVDHLIPLFERLARSVLSYVWY